ncbi:uncharacterized protein LOC112560041 [Pomacea canaliculata]|uniref:uncharacterized protein LOC112560041 n=1 Tax=Pomacea canaliculata TaxID=400727 RepID=UPI000D739DA4|nr:uncharacterized protein LOC112560041 [Pomacea canaliculata]XP_025087390.1 uncharacterized protein LOC112560041 [Pomacea canaliculata]XP_025087391.1 uncharacterized protein LOC112560041 [Pomacea canaliculata]XP_025087393.1 uncharacterized protein LOC112560041 [Pomacea canaliculata]XP_025087394.1 uncharacterized protein LOC112560041 [Pomacea canaliculata]
MAILSSFLCWSNTRTGSAICAYYSLVVSVVCMSLYVFRYLAQGKIDAVPEYKGIVYPGFVLYTVMIGVSLVMLPGVYMDKRFLLLPWVYTLVVIVLYETGAIALLTTVHLSQDKVLRAWEIGSLCFYCFRLIANCYCFACVVSQYQELSEGRGTYEFLYKPRRRQHLSQPLADGDLYSPPYWAQLPPYSKVDLHKEFNPPGYEEAADQSHAAYDNPAFVTASSASLSASLQSCRGQQQGQGQAITPGDVACPAPSHRPRAER